MLEPTETARLQSLYENLRERLLDMSLRNPMLSYKHRPTSKRQLGIVDEVPQAIYSLLTDGAALEILPLPEPDDTPKDERTKEFAAALQHAKVADVEYLTQIKALESAGRDDEFEVAKADRALRDRVRASQGLPPRPNRKTVNPAEHARELGINPSIELAARSSKDAHADRRLQTLKWPDDLQANLERIADEARLAEQETGLSTLFLAFGFLEWSEGDSARKLFAPLLLLPVKLLRRKTARGKIAFSLSASAEAAESNLSLQKKLERDFAILLPELGSEAEAAASVEDYFAKVRAAIAGQKGWQVRRFLTLGHFAFGRFAIYADLAPGNWGGHPVTDRLVGAVVRGTESAGEGGNPLLGSPDDYFIDDPEIEKLAPILIHDADASQHSALVDVMKGKNLVIQGPPGTGKSQTITNIIANALAAGRTVLFLAEKQAALDVVKRRLTTAGLGDFCLELHSEKASPRLVVDSLNERSKLGIGLPAGGALPPDATWDRCRKDLTAHVNALHAAGDHGQAPFGLIWQSLRTSTDLGSVMEAFRGVALPKPLLSQAAEYRSVADDVGQYARMAEGFVASFGPPESSGWARLTYRLDARPVPAGLLAELASLRERAAAVAKVIAEAADLGIGDLAGLVQLVELDGQLPAAPLPGAPVAKVAGLERAELNTLIELQTTSRRLAAEVAGHPEVQGAQEPDMDLVPRLVETVAGTDLARLSPADLYGQAERGIAAGDTLLRGLAGLAPAAEALGGSQALPSGSARGLVLAAQFAAGLTADERRRFNGAPAQASVSFESALAAWRVLTSDEARWRGRFPRRADAHWPAPDELRAAAAVAAKGTLARMFGALTGEGKVLAAVVERLGLMAGTGLPAQDLRALADHAEALTEFLSDRAFREMLGSDWAGLDSPLDQVAAVRAKRAAALAMVARAPFGADVAERLGALDEAGLVRLAATHETAKAAFAGLDGLEADLDGLPFADKRAEIERRRTTFEALLSLDPARSLARFGLPLADLARALRTEAARRSALAQLEAHPLAALADDLAGTDAAVAATLAAAEWIGSVRRLPAPDTLRDALVSGEARSARARVASVAPTAALTIAGLRAQAATVERLHGVGGFAIAQPERLVEVLDDLLTRRDELVQFLSLRDQRAQVLAAGLGPFLDIAEQHHVAPAVLPSLLAGLVALRRAEAVRATDPVLSRTSGLLIETRRGEFAERDRRKLEADRRRVRDRLLVAVPPAGVGIGPRRSWTEMQLLRNEFNKEKRFVAVRDLMTRAPGAIRALTPCFMMSPLSLAKFLPAGRMRFDLVVIDEASQMRPEDALGGLLRAGQLVVVGDPKQLPPSDFFSRSGETGAAEVDADEAEDFEELDDESILESCQKAFRETRLLRWHYRSRCESLIGFSNREFYGDELITFPMARPGSFSIDLVRVNGPYEARRNSAEAAAIADEAVRFMRHHAEGQPETVPTLGVVAVNTDQRDLILEEIRRLEAGDAAIETYREKVAGRGEPVFVKNLENVQGDERDFILVSMTYGPKPGAKVLLQRFGPINGRHGHRRLNVLFTRARVRIGLFTSFGSADVKPSETSALGVHVLKRYLEYAENRGYREAELTGRHPDSDFEIEVARRLRSRGYEVDCQVGASGFRIDLGVRHPDHPERYLAGVECDGARYHSGRSARDRDRLREEVLAGLGWNIVRVWSTDWFDGPDAQTERLVKRLEELRSKAPPAHTGYAFARTDEGGEAELETARQDVREPAEVVSADVEFDAAGSGEAADAAVVADATDIAEMPADEPSRLADGTGPLTAAELGHALREFRDKVVAPEMPAWEPGRSILRDGMIETFIAQRLDDPDDWFRKVPQYQRQGTNPAERTRYLERICDLVARLEGATARPPPPPELPRQESLPL